MSCQPFMKTVFNLKRKYIAYIANDVSQRNRSPQVTVVSESVSWRTAGYLSDRIDFSTWERERRRERDTQRFLQKHFCKHFWLFIFPLEVSCWQLHFPAILLLHEDKRKKPRHKIGQTLSLQIQNSLQIYSLYPDWLLVLCLLWELTS